MKCNFLERYKNLLDKRNSLAEELARISYIHSTTTSANSKTNKINSFEELFIREQSILKEIELLDIEVKTCEVRLCLIPKEYMPIIDMYYVQGIKKAEVMRKLKITNHFFKKALEEIVNILDYGLFPY